MAVCARYRWGYLGVGLGGSLDEAVSARGPGALYEASCGDDLDGCMDTDELRRHLVGLLHFSGDLQVQGEPDWTTPRSLDWLRGWKGE